MSYKFSQHNINVSVKTKLTALLVHIVDFFGPSINYIIRKRINLDVISLHVNSTFS